MPPIHGHAGYRTGPFGACWVFSTSSWVTPAKPWQLSLSPSWSMWCSTAHCSVKQICKQTMASCKAPVSIAALLDPLTGICCWRHSQLWFRKVEREGCFSKEFEEEAEARARCSSAHLYSSLDALRCCALSRDDLSVPWLWGDHTVQTGICPTQHKFSA